uniref:Uncharacterized protein n=1 Tax=Anguilla anguilla TaxID=7936 RepID=A0A0E9T2Q5_ANGAN
MELQYHRACDYFYTDCSITCSVNMMEKRLI